MESLTERRLGAAERLTGRPDQQELLWIEAAQNGDDVAFNRIVLSWEQRIYNLTLRMLHYREEAEDVTQDIFVSLYRNIEKFRRDARFSTWLYKISINHCLSRLRKRPIGDLFLDDEAELPGRHEGLRRRPEQETRVLDSERRRAIRHSLAALTAEQRTVIELKFFQELTFDEIAGVLEIPSSTVKSRFYAALDVLKGRLGAFSEG